MRMIFLILSSTTVACFYNYISTDNNKIHHHRVVHEMNFRDFNNIWNSPNEKHVNFNDEDNNNNDDNENHNRRSKRFLIFNGGGIIKFVFGLSVPIKFSSLKNRQLTAIYNFQIQYMQPTRPYNVTTSSNYDIFNFLANNNDRRGFDEMKKIRELKNKKLSKDSSREYIYSLIENAFESNGFNGKHCLLKIICEVGQYPIYGDTIVHEILRKILTPTVNNINKDYVDARKAGIYGIDCSSAYPNCAVKNILNKFSIFL